jgi:hypothetical protein
MIRRLRIFLSSPGDVTATREIAALTIERLAHDYARFFAIEPYLWEYEDPSAFDTEWEYEEAQKAAQETGTPDLLVYRSRERSTRDSAPERRRRPDYADRVTGVLYSLEIPPMTEV